MKYLELINNPDYEKIEELNHDELKTVLHREIAGNQGWGLIAKNVSGNWFAVDWFCTDKSFCSIHDAT